MAILERSPGKLRLNLAAINETLVEFQRNFCEISRHLNAAREPFTDEVRDNMLCGYHRVDEALSNDIDLFKQGNSGVLLEWNQVVLYGTDSARRRRYARSILANEARYYEKPEGGIGALLEGYRMHGLESVWNRCSLVYIHMLSRPQLFIEGNHRTAVLVMSYLLTREGHSPVVLSQANAADFLNPSAAIGRYGRHSLQMVFRRPRLKRHIAQLLQAASNPALLMTEPETAG